MANLLNPEKALIFRIVHRDNVPWIVANGLHCRNSEMLDPNYKIIGNRDLIAKRQEREVPLAPGGTLGDYVPFYFTPYSPMLYNIKTGYGDVEQCQNDEIVFLVSSLPKLSDEGLPFVFTDRHAYIQYANFYSDLSDVDKLDWAHLIARDFRRDTEDPEKIERYQAEALVYRDVPISGLLGAACHSPTVKSELEGKLGPGNLLPIKVRPDWYFT